MILRDIRKILVIKLRHIGDVLLTVPVFRALRENFPRAYIAAFVNSGTEDVLTGNPLIDEIMVFDREIKRLKLLQKYLKELSFLRMIRSRDFDMTVDLTSGDRAAIISFVSRARYRLAYDPCDNGFPWKRYLYTHLAKKDGSQHMVLQDLDIVRQFGISTNNLNVDFFVPDDARAFVKRVFEENNINPSSPPFTEGGRGGLKVVHVHPTSRWLFKCWRDEYMAEVISWLLDIGTIVIVTSSPDKREMEKSQRILSLIPNLQSRNSAVINLCGKTTIKQLGAVSEASDLFFGVDSAPMHIAAAAGTPVIALFGPMGIFNWFPWGNKIEEIPHDVRHPRFKGTRTFNSHTVIQKDWDCVPCGGRKCGGDEMRRCMELITPDEVKKVIREKLNIL